MMPIDFRNNVRTRPERIGGLVVGGLPHRILLALRAPGGLTQDQVRERFPGKNTEAMTELRRAGLIDALARGKKGETVRITDAGRAAVSPDGPLARARSLITYCQL